MMKQIRLSQQAKDKLARLKGKTGISSWNVLCRWALCYSLSENSIPTEMDLLEVSNLEMSWYTFAGEYSEVYEVLLKQWCLESGLPADEKTLNKYLILHLERGIAHLSGTGFIKNIDCLLQLTEN